MVIIYANNNQKQLNMLGQSIFLGYREFHVTVQHPLVLLEAVEHQSSEPYLLLSPFER
jgi:hypothetical protein